MKKLLTDIELDFYELKCLLEYLDKNPQDNRLYKVAQRSLYHLTDRMSELKKGFDETYVDAEADIVEAKQEVKAKVDVFTPLREAEPIIEQTSKEADFILPELDVEEEATTEVVEEIAKVVEEPAPKPTISGIESGVMFRALSLNDVFRFSRELFKDDSQKLKDAIAEMERLGSYEQSIGFLSTVVECPLDDFAFQDMDDFLKRFYKL